MNKEGWTIGYFATHEELDEYQLIEDLKLTPTERFRQGQMLIKWAYKLQGKMLPSKIEPIFGFRNLGEEID